MDTLSVIIYIFHQDFLKNILHIKRIQLGLLIELKDPEGWAL